MHRFARVASALACLGCLHAGIAAAAPTLLDPSLQAVTLADGLVTPVSMAFIGSNDLLVLEKNTGRVQRVVAGSPHSTVLDLAVNSASERGLLGIALDPNFAVNRAVYLYWTESTTGADTNVLSNTPLLGNRVDRFVWDGSNLLFDQNLLRLRAVQADDGQPERGNHNGGVLRFGPDGKLYVAVGDVGRRGQLQNLPDGPFGPGMPDDQFGGPAPDSAHFTGVILRLNTDGTAADDNPFFAAGAAIGGEVGANIQKIYAYGIRNTFGMAFDPLSGSLWAQDNGDDAFDEINLVEAGMNGGWVQVMGPLARLAEYKAIETSAEFFGLQQIRWPPTNIAGSEADALAAMFMLPGAEYGDPQFSWKYGVAPGAVGFMDGLGLGAGYAGDLFVGASTTLLEGGYLFRFPLSAGRTGFELSDPLLHDLVADNLAKHDLTESDSLLFGRNFGIVTDIQTGPNGNLFLVSLSDGAIYEIRLAAVPEPGTLLLLAPVLLLLYGHASRRRARS